MHRPGILSAVKTQKLSQFDRSAAFTRRSSVSKSSLARGHLSPGVANAAALPLSLEDGAIVRWVHTVYMTADESKPGRTGAWC